MIAKIFEVITQAVTAFVGSLGTAVNSITSLFYVDETGFTMLGTLILISAGVGLVYWAFRLIRGLISQRK
ncbi:MAG: hypothetical protein J1F31_02245 [Erysipelotrichales bacterium]|nr:hypothetical protein [Erysipelotrichales bacterium]